MGWLIVGLLLLLILGLSAHFRAKRKKPGRHKVADVNIYDEVERTCQESTESRGQFEIDLGELSELDWLELGSHSFAQDQFKAIVKWRNQGTQCIYKVVATAGEGDESITKQSTKNIIPLKS